MTQKIFNPTNKGQAWEGIWNGLGWFIQHKPILTIPIVLWMCFGGFVGFGLNATTEKMTLKEAKPLSQNINLDKIHQALFIDDKTNEIIFNGKLWGYENPDVVIKKEMGKNNCKVFYKPTGKVYDMEFTLDITAQMKKQ